MSDNDSFALAHYKAFIILNTGKEQIKGRFLQVLFQSNPNENSVPPSDKTKYVIVSSTLLSMTRSCNLKKKHQALLVLQVLHKFISIVPTFEAQAIQKQIMSIFGYFSVLNSLLKSGQIRKKTKLS